MSKYTPKTPSIKFVVKPPPIIKVPIYTPPHVKVPVAPIVFKVPAPTPANIALQSLKPARSPLSHQYILHHLLKRR